METRCISGWFLLCLLSVSECSQVIGIEGQNITLPFKYDAKSHGLQHICWGKGTIPSSGGCDNEIISTDGSEVTSRSSVRYQLLGDLKTGDVTLTISNTTEKDSGTYGCRVQYVGLFNDEKYHVTLTIEKAPVPTTSETSTNVTITPQTTDNHNHGRVTTISTEYSSTLHYSKSESETRGHDLAGILVSILLVLTGVVIVSVLVMRKRCKRIATVLQIWKFHQQWAFSPLPALPWEEVSRGVTVALAVLPGDVTSSVPPENTAPHSDALSLRHPARSQHTPSTSTHRIYKMAASSGPLFRRRWILVLLTVTARCSVSAFKVMEGATATLSCQYSVSRLGLSRVCWGRECGTFWCNNILAQTDKHGVISKVSDRYRLAGDVLAGEMDLGILNVKRTDSGPYCCRVDIDGIFNDKKIIQNLRVMKAPVTVLPRSTTVHVTEAPPTTEHWRAVESSHLAIPRQNTSVFPLRTLIEEPLPSFSLQINIPVLSLSLSLLLLIMGALVILGFKRGIHRRALKTGCLSAEEPPHIIYEIRMRRPVEENIYTLD